MSARFTKVIRSVLAVGMLLGLLSCGSSSNNDQGTSFTALGFYAVTTENGVIAVDPEIPISGLYAVPNPDSSNFFNLDLNTVLAGVGVQNRLSSQFIRLVRADFQYEVPGASASLNIPGDSSPLPGILEAAGGTGSTSSGATTTGTSQAFAIVQAVSPDVLSFLNINQNSLPQLPFRMNVTVAVTGVTQSGDTVITNPITIWVQFAEQAEGVPEAPATPGTGGDVDTGDSDSSSSSSAARVVNATIVEEAPVADEVAEELLDLGNE